MSIMGVPRQTVPIYNHLSRHTTQFEKVHFLAVAFEHAVVWIGNARIGKIFPFPITGKGSSILGADYQHLGIAFHKLAVVLAQLRHVPLAKRSGKATVKDQHHVLLTSKIG